MKKNLAIISLFFSLFLTACGISEDTENRDDSNNQETKSTQEENEIVEAVGIITPKSVSLFGGGTHFLTDEENNVLYALESKVEDLSRFENNTVRIKGEKQGKNSETNQELLSVITIETQEENNEEVSNQPVLIELKDFNMTVIVPNDWQEEKENGNWTFLNPSDEEVIKIEKFAENSAQAAEIRDIAQEAENITVGGKAAYRVRNGAEMDVYILNEDNLIAFRFDPQSDEIKERRVFLDILTNLTWLDEENDSLNSEEENGEETTEEENLSCGGEENKICPLGYRCELTSTQENATGNCIRVDLSEEAEEENQCPETLKKCPDGSFVAPDEDNNCQYPACPDPIEEEIIEEEAIISEEVEGENAENTENTEESVSDDQINQPDREVRAPKDEYYQIENTYYEFSLDAPSNYFWQNFGRIGDSLVYIGLSDQEMEESDEALITVELVNQETETKKISVDANIVTITVPDQESGSYIIKGSAEYKDVLEHIADSIQPLENEERE